MSAPKPCAICGRAPWVDSFPGPKGSAVPLVFVIVQCTRHMIGQVSMVADNFADAHCAALAAWNDYQDSAQARMAGAA